MTWVAWRQFRPQASAGLVLLVVVVAILAITGPMLSHDYHVYLRALPSCQASGCDSAQGKFLSYFTHIRLLGTLLIALPGVLGVFWGAPLVTRELEAGTQRLAWTQSVTRTRWLVTKLAVVGVATMVVVGLFSLAFTWWSAPLDHVRLDRLSPEIFDQRGLVPIGYAAFAFALGVVVGIVVRRTLAAMGITLVLFVAIRMIFQYDVRPNLYAAAHKILPLSSGNGLGFDRTATGVGVSAGQPNIPGAWISSSNVVNAAGHAPTAAVVNQLCPKILNVGPPPGNAHIAVQAPAGAQSAFTACIHALSASYHLDIAYQPASRYWLFQWTETGIYLALALALAGLAAWWLRSRLQ